MPFGKINGLIREKAGFERGKGGKYPAGGIIRLVLYRGYEAEGTKIIGCRVISINGIIEGSPDVGEVHGGWDPSQEIPVIAAADIYIS